MDRGITMVIPCFNEAGRLRFDQFRRFAAENTDVGFLFVNDGSTDSTGEILARETAAHPQLGALLSLQENVGKGEAVRLGLRQAIENGARFVGYWDADLATPLEELYGMVRWFETDPEIHGILGSRVRLLGRSIERRPARHYLGRAFATVASMVLGLSVYDTQCGAKVFRVTSHLERVLESPFRSRWIFDVELLARLKGAFGETTEKKLREYPIHSWKDVDGSKIKPLDFVSALLDLVGIGRHLYERHLEEEETVR